MPDNKTTTITLTVGTKKDLDNMKIHPRQTYEEVIKNIIRKTKGEPSPVKDQGNASNLTQFGAQATHTEEKYVNDKTPSKIQNRSPESL